MKELLARLQGLPGVRGSLVMTLDGVVVAALPETLDHARIAAFLSAVLVSVEKSAESLGLVPLQRLTLSTGRGRLLLMPVGELALALVADDKSDLTTALTEVSGLVRRLLRRSRIDVPTT